MLVMTLMDYYWKMEVVLVLQGNDKMNISSNRMVGSTQKVEFSNNSDLKNIFKN